MLSRFGLSDRVLAVVATSFAAAAAVAWLGLDSDAAPTPPQPALVIAPPAMTAPIATTVPVLVATGTIEVGSQITPEAIAQVAMAKTSQTDTFLMDTPANRQTLSGLAAPRTIPAGTPFVPSDLVPPPVTRQAVEVSGTAALLAPGMRAISLPVTTEMAVAGLITRGDRLDILVTYDAPDNMRAVRTVLRNVRVIATDQTTEVSHETPSAPPKTVTLELHPEGAKVLALAMRTGNLVLVLSPPDGGDLPVIADDEPILSSQISGIAPPAETASGKSVRIIRGTAPSNTIMVPVRSIQGAAGQIQPGSIAPQTITVNPSN